MSIQQILERAVSAQQAGQLDEAARLYREALEINPSQHDALHLLGLIEFQRGNKEQGLFHVQKALQVRPDWPEALCNLGIALQSQKKLDEAVAVYRRALEVDPDYLEARVKLANALQARCRSQEATVYGKNALRPKPGSPHLQALNAEFAVVSQYTLLSKRFEKVQGYLQSYEGFVLYRLAKHWPLKGRTVEIGSFKGRSTCWLATGCKEGNHGKVAAVDHFTGSPEHQQGGTHEDADIVAHGSTLSIFRANLEKFGLSDWVTIHAGSSMEVSRDWNEAIRLLFIDGDHSYKASKEGFDSWSRHVLKNGIIIFHDVQVWRGVTKLYNELRSKPTEWRSIGRYQSLGVLERQF